MDAPRRPPDALTIPQLARLSALWFGLQFFWVSQQLFVMPQQVERFVGKEHFGFYLGLIKGVGAVIVIITQLSAGFLSDHAYSKLGRRRPFIVSGVVCGLFAVSAYMLAPGYWWLFTAYLLIELTLNSAMVPFQSLLPDLVPLRQHSRAGSMMGLLDLSGTLLGLLSFIVLIVLFQGKEVAGYHTFLLPLYLVLLVALMLATVLGIDERGWAQHPREQLAGAARELRLWLGVTVRYAATGRTLLGCIVRDYAKVVRHYAKVDIGGQTNLIWLACSRAAIFFGYAAFITYVRKYVENNLDCVGFLTTLRLDHDTALKLAAMVSPVVLLFFILGGLAGNLAAAPLAERHGKRQVIIWGMSLAGVMLVPLIFTHSVWAAICCGALLGSGWGAFVAIDWAFACTLMPKQHTGMYMAFWGITSLLPQVISPSVAGALRDPLFAYGTAHGLDPRAAAALAHQWVFGLIIVAFLLGMILVRNVREARPERTARSAV